MATFQIRDLVQRYHRARVFESRGCYVCEHPDCEKILTQDEVESGYKFCAFHTKVVHDAETNPVG